jgi:hypothetical protein
MTPTRKYYRYQCPECARTYHYGKWLSKDHPEIKKLIDDDNSGLLSGYRLEVVTTRRCVYCAAEEIRL